MTLTAAAANAGFREHGMPTILLRRRHDKHERHTAENQQAQKPHDLTGDFHVAPLKITVGYSHNHYKRMGAPTIAH